MEQAIRCAGLGAHLFIEKPISHCIDEEGFALLSKVITEKKLHLQVGYMMRYHPLLLKVREAVEENAFIELNTRNRIYFEDLPS